MTAITTIPLNYSTASRGFCLRRHRVLSASRQYRTEAVRCNMSAENQENRGLPTKKAKFGDGSVGMTEKTARGIRSPLSSSENNIEHVQTASVADTASSTSNIFNNTEERAMTAEEEEEKTARDRREPTRRRLLRIETLLIGPLARNRIKIPSSRELRANWETCHEVRYEQHSASNNIAATLQRVEGETTAVEEDS
ncbi:hypothetical protein B9Z55_003335 [Caenorhabditis nigoni]|uniref:Uncharacterized protein n=1 Tax=Caenorhabditis nigoni TaxID=1611254 RepID=A0A2G5VPN6_9PELO|nr:hypothetical protein B9Z55_003335 [Caenorhabditis nigoni]